MESMHGGGPALRLLETPFQEVYQDPVISGTLLIHRAAHPVPVTGAGI